MTVSSTRLSAFLRILDEGGLSAAARSLGVTQPTLSSTLARLERDLGVRLFDRSPSGLLVTREGRAIEKLARRALVAQRSLDETASALREGREGRLTLAVVAGHQHSAFVPPLIGAFHRQYPLVQVFVDDHPSADAVATAIRSGRADLGVCSDFEGDDLERTNLPPQQLALVLPASWPPVDSLGALVDRPEALPLVETNRARGENGRRLDALGISSRMIAEVPTSALPGAVIQGLGATIISAAVGSLLSHVGCSVLALPGQRLTGVLLHRDDDQNPAVRGMLVAALDVTTSAGVLGEQSCLDDQGGERP